MFKFMWKYPARWTSGDAITFVHALIVLCRHRSIDHKLAAPADGSPAMYFWAAGDEGILTDQLQERDVAAIRLYYSSFSLDFEDERVTRQEVFPS